MVNYAISISRSITVNDSETYIFVSVKIERDNLIFPITSVMEVEHKIVNKHVKAIMRFSAIMINRQPGDALKHALILLGYLGYSFGGGRWEQTSACATT